MAKKNFETLEVGKEYLDRLGVKRLVFAKHPHTDIFIVAGFENDDLWQVYPDGKYYSCDIESPIDLITLVEPVEVREYWINVYESGYSALIYPIKREADNCATDDRIDCIHTRLEYQNGKLVNSEIRSVMDAEKAEI